MVPSWIYALGVAVIVLGVTYGVRNQMATMIVGPTNTLKLPSLWWYVDDSQMNSRQWLDWGNRATSEPNEPYLKICQARAMTLWDDDFTFEPIIGRAAAIQRLQAAGCRIPDGADRCPPALWMPWCRAAFLSSLGGMWLDGSVLPMGADLKRRVLAADVVMFGTDPDEGLSAAEATAPAAGRSAGWAAVPHHPVWSGLERDLAGLIAQGDQSWSAPTARRSLRWLWDKHCSGVVTVDRVAEISRDRYGRRLELDTLLGQTEWVDGTTDGGLWVAWPDGRDGLDRASRWQWFSRMSVEQIREAEFVWAKWATQLK